MDRQEKIKKNESSENGSENGSNEESDSEEKVSFVIKLQYESPKQIPMTSFLGKIK